MTKQQIEEFMEGSEKRLEVLNRHIASAMKNHGTVKNILFPGEGGYVGELSTAIGKLVDGTDFMSHWNAENYGKAFMSLDEEVRLAAFAETRHLVPEHLRYDVFCMIMSHCSETRLIQPWLVMEMVELMPMGPKKDQIKENFNRALAFAKESAPQVQ